MLTHIRVAGLFLTTQVAGNITFLILICSSSHGFFRPPFTPPLAQSPQQLPTFSQSSFAFILAPFINACFPELQITCPKLVDILSPAHIRERSNDLCRKYLIAFQLEHNMHRMRVHHKPHNCKTILIDVGNCRTIAAECCIFRAIQSLVAFAKKGRTSASGRKRENTKTGGSRKARKLRVNFGWNAKNAHWNNRFDICANEGRNFLLAATMRPNHCAMQIINVSRKIWVIRFAWVKFDIANRNCLCGCRNKWWVSSLHLCLMREQLWERCLHSASENKKNGTFSHRQDHCLGIDGNGQRVRVGIWCDPLKWHTNPFGYRKLQLDDLICNLHGHYICVGIGFGQSNYHIERVMWPAAEWHTKMTMSH